MTTTEQRIADRFRAIDAVREEWPIYMVMRETIPAPMRLLVAAAAALEWEHSKEFASLLLDALDTNAPVMVIDDSVLCPAAPADHDVRDFIRWWCRGDGMETIIASKVRLTRARLDSPARKQSPDLTLLAEISDLRWLGLAQIAEQHKYTPFEHPLLRSAVEGFERLATAATHDRVDEPLRPIGDSRFLRAAWFKHCGEMAALHPSPVVAKIVWEQALTAVRELPHHSWVKTMELSLRLSMLSCSVLLDGPVGAAAELKELREANRGTPDADRVQWLRFQVAHKREMLSEQDPRELETKPPLVLSAYDFSSALYQAREKISFDAQMREVDDAERTWWVGMRLSAGNGLLPFHELLYGERGLALLRRDPPDVANAVECIVMSGHTSFVKRVEETLEAVRDVAATSITPELLERLAVIAKSVPGEVQFREATRAQLLGAFARFGSLSEATRAELFKQLMALAIGGATAEFANANSRSAAIAGLLTVVQSASPTFRKERIAEIAQVAGLLLGRQDQSWTSIEQGLMILDSSKSELPSELSSGLVEAALNMLETRPMMPGGDWVIVRPTLLLLTNSPFIEVVKSDSGRVERVRSLILRFCFGGEDPEKLSAWEMGLALWEALDGTLPSEAQKLVGFHRKAAQVTGSSDAGRAVQRLLRHAQLLDGDVLIELITDLQMIIRSRTSDRGPVSGNAVAIALIQIARDWHKLTTRAGERQTDFEAAANELLDDVVTFMRDAETNHYLLAIMAFPRRTTANEAVTYNWTYGALSLAHVLGRSSTIRDVLTKVADSTASAVIQHEVVRAISDFDAYGIGGVGAAGVPTMNDIRDIDAAKFYLEVGSLLYRALGAPTKPQLLAALGSRCLSLGPRTEDLAVLSAAASDKEALSSLANDPAIDGYRDRLRRPARGDLDKSARVVLVDVVERIYSARPTSGSTT